MLETTFTLKDVKREIPRAYFVRGLEYKQGKHVIQLTEEMFGKKITAKVRGSSRNRYDVVIHINTEFHPLRISGVCSCPIAYNCKHVAAVLLERLGVAYESPVEEGHTIPTTNEVKVEPLQNWSERIQATKPPESETIYPIPHLFLYASDISAFGPVNWLDSKKIEQTPLVRVSFDYANKQVDWADSTESIRINAANKPIDAARNTAYEKQIIELLKDLGFRTLSSRDGESFSEKFANDFYLNEQQIHFLQFTHYFVPLFRTAGWRVTIDESYPYQIIEQSDDWYANLEEDNINHWFDFELGIQVNGERINLLPLLLEALNDPTLFDSNENISLDHNQNKIFLLRLPNNHILPVPIERLRNILGTLYTLFDKEVTDKGRLRLSAYHASLLHEFEAGEQAAKLRWFGGQRLLRIADQLRQFSTIEEVEIDDGFHAVLRPYQHRGVAWLQFLHQFGFGGILADDMGLGKTVQALAHIHIEKRLGRLNNPILVIAPTSLIFNWKMEAQRFVPDLKILTLHGPQRHELFDDMAKYDLILTSYPLLVRDKDELMRHTFHLIILDEAQTIKNPKAKVTQIALQLTAHHRLCLTGTPIENHLGEIWSIFHFLMPGFLGSGEQFRKYYRTPIEKLGNQEKQLQLTRRIAPFLLRRTKDAVAQELPKKTEIVRSVEIDGEQRDLYESIRLAMHQRVRQEITERGLARSHILILDALLKLRQVCCDPRLLRIPRDTSQIPSAKLNLLLEMLPELIEEGRRILLFSQFVTMLELIEPEIQKLRIPFVKLTGQTKDRQTPVEQFQNGEVPLFLISLKAGGTGLNLTAADTVIHFDPWWNPAVENQATDRAHRIGQDKPVFVYKLLTAGTVEEKMQQLQARKANLAQSVYSGSQKTEDTLTAEDLNVLFEPLY